MPHILQFSDIRVVDVDSLVLELENLVEEDNHSFCLENKSKLIKSFIVLRICNILFSIIEKNKNFKLIYLVNKKSKLILLEPYYNFVYAIFIKIAKLLSIAYIIDSKDIKEYEMLLTLDSGESKEIKIKLQKVLNSLNKRPNFEKFKTLLERYNITSTKVLSNSFNVKLGLFLT